MAADEYHRETVALIKDFITAQADPWQVDPWSLAEPATRLQNIVRACDDAVVPYIADVCRHIQLWGHPVGTDTDRIAANQAIERLQAFCTSGS